MSQGVASYIPCDQEEKTRSKRHRSGKALLLNLLLSGNWQVIVQVFILCLFGSPSATHFMAEYISANPLVPTVQVPLLYPLAASYPSPYPAFPARPGPADDRYRSSKSTMNSSSIYFSLPGWHANPSNDSPRMQGVEVGPAWVTGEQQRLSVSLLFSTSARAILATQVVILPITTRPTMQVRRMSRRVYALLPPI